MKNRIKLIIPGGVIFCAEGADIERFITFCVKKGIEIKKPIKNGYKMTGKVSAVNYKKLRKPARAFGLKLRIIKKHGTYFLIKKHRNSYGFIFGILFSLIMISIMNMFIWEIDITGNKAVSYNDIIKSAENAGLKTGTSAEKHFAQNIEWYILRENEGLASVEINIQGSKASIIVNEIKEKENFKSDDDIPVNLVSKKYGIIRKAEVFDGQSVVKPGDAVNKGDLLVSAVYEDRHNKLTLKHARANIIAETDFIKEIVFPLEKTIKTKGKYIGKKYEISFLGFKKAFGKKRTENELYIEENEINLCFFNVKLPIKMKITTFYAVKENNITYDIDGAKENAYDLLERYEKDKMSEMKIISRKTEEKIKDNKYIINADYIVLMDIAEEQPILSDIPWENSDDMS